MKTRYFSNFTLAPHSTLFYNYFNFKNLSILKFLLFNKKKSNSFKIKKNIFLKYFFLHNYKSKIKLNWFFKLDFNLMSLFNLLFITKYKKKKLLKKKKNFFFNFENFVFKNFNDYWFFTTGNLLVYNNLSYLYKAKKFTEETTINWDNNSDYTNYDFLDKKILKKFYFNNYFYFQNLNFTYSNLKFYFLNETLFNNIENQSFLSYKPYNIFNDFLLYIKESEKLQNFIYDHFKKFSKMFNLQKNLIESKKEDFESFNMKYVLINDNFFESDINQYKNEYDISETLLLFNFFMNKFNYFPLTKTKRVFFFKKKFIFKFSFFKKKFLILKKLKKSIPFAKKKNIIIFNEKTNFSIENYFLNFYNFFFNSIFNFNNYTCLYDKISTYNVFFSKNFFLYYIFLIKENYNFILKNEYSYIFEFYKKPFINSKENTNFILNTYGFIYITGCFFFNIYLENKIFLFKKINYSFILKNELQRYILNNLLKLYLPNLLLSKNVNDHVSSLNNLFGDSKNIFQNYLSIKNPLYSYNSLNFKNSFLSNIFYSFFLNEDVNDQANFHEIQDNFYNLNIKRIKFKPGYSILWRNARSTFLQNFNLKKKTQYKLTKYLSKFKKLVKYNLLLNLEMRLVNILLKSRIVFDLQLANKFILNGLIFINGLNCFNPNIQTYKGDFIQIITHNKYYILFKWLFSWYLKKKTKLKIKTRRKFLFFPSETPKTRSFKLPNWILYNKSLVSDISKYLEVDYFTLSIFIIYEPILWSELNFFNYVGIKFNILNMYNWKYIT